MVSQTTLILANRKSPLTVLSRHTDSYVEGRVWVCLPSFRKVLYRINLIVLYLINTSFRTKHPHFPYTPTTTQPPPPPQSHSPQPSSSQIIVPPEPSSQRQACSSPGSQPGVPILMDRPQPTTITAKATSSKKSAASRTITWFLSRFMGFILPTFGLGRRETAMLRHRLRRPARHRSEDRRQTRSRPPGYR